MINPVVKDINDKIDYRTSLIKEAKRKLRSLKRRMIDILITAKRMESFDCDAFIYSSYVINCPKHKDPYIAVDKLDDKFYEYSIRIGCIDGPMGYSIAFTPNFFGVKTESTRKLDKNLTLEEYNLLLDNFDEFEENFYKAVNNKLSKI